MVRKIKSFFYPPTTTYLYKETKETVAYKILDGIENGVCYVEPDSYTGGFISRDSFSINLVSLLRRRQPIPISKLIGEISESPKTEIVVGIKVIPGFALYITFIASLLLGIIYLIKFCIGSTIGFLLFGIGMAVFGPIIAIRIYNVASDSLKHRYCIHIHDKLK